MSFPLILGYIFDLLIGDPYRMPHPIKLFGNVISFAEKRFSRGAYLRLKGSLVAGALVLLVFFVFFLIDRLTAPNVWLHHFVVAVLVFYGLANRCLVDEALRVEHQLTQHGLEAGRKQLSFIVGRDTRNLDANSIRTAVLETLSENLSDGVIAPLFYYALGGVPLMFAYKMVNTLDSMVGYKNERYLRFGWFSARLDDLLNFIPARITALLMVLVTFSWRGVAFVFKYGHKHTSPNSGYPESALAGILNCRFGGPNVYHGVLVSKPYIGHNQRDITRADIRKA
ncbi:MAG: adenosylcobinamide-phosphate synthase CbiB, partial [Tenuifilaceae bacterium]|nr:adenosylcobinamide-phosphate synthase CbiB [Tenuifilaceae bacterium]